MAKRLGIRVLTSKGEYALYSAYGHEECVSCHRTLTHSEHFTKGIGSVGNNQSPYCGTCIPYTVTYDETSRQKRGNR